MGTESMEKELSVWSVPLETGGSLGGLDNGCEGPDVLFIHNAGACALSWAPLMRQLKDLHCVAMDQRGHTHSFTAPPQDATENWRDVLRVIEGLGLRRPVVVGHNTGGIMALFAGADAPDVIGAVVTLEMGLRDVSREVFHDDLIMAQSEEFMTDLCTRFGLGEVAHSLEEVEAAVAAQVARTETDWLLADVGDDVAEDTRYAFVQRPDGTWLHTPDRDTLRTLLRIDVDATYYPTADHYDLLTVPVHIAQSEHGMNQLTPQEIDTLLARLPNYTVHPIGGGHLAHRAHPNTMAAIVRAAVASVRGRD